jgi:hypothetical protein
MECCVALIVGYVCNVLDGNGFGLHDMKNSRENQSEI